MKLIQRNIKRETKRKTKRDIQQDIMRQIERDTEKETEIYIKRDTKRLFLKRQDFKINFNLNH